MPCLPPHVLFLRRAVVTDVPDIAYVTPEDGAGADRRTPMRSLCCREKSVFFFRPEYHSVRNCFVF